MPDLLSHALFRNAFFGPALSQLLLLLTGVALLGLGLAVHRGPRAPRNSGERWTDERARAPCRPCRRRGRGPRSRRRRLRQGHVRGAHLRRRPDLGLAQILWSVTAKDYATTDTALIERRVLDQTERDGIILLHERCTGTIPAVPGIIRGLRARGFTFVTVSQPMYPARPLPGTVYRP